MIRRCLRLLSWLQFYSPRSSSRPRCTRRAGSREGGPRLCRSAQGALSHSPASPPAPGSRGVPEAPCAEPGAAPGRRPGTSEGVCGRGCVLCVLPMTGVHPGAFQQAVRSHPPAALRWSVPSGGAHGKQPACQCSRWKRRGFDPRVGQIPWRGHGNPLQDSCLENPTDRGAWWATVHGSQSQT